MSATQPGREAGGSAHAAAACTALPAAAPVLGVHGAEQPRWGLDEPSNSARLFGRAATKQCRRSQSYYKRCGSSAQHALEPKRVFRYPTRRGAQPAHQKPSWPTNPLFALSCTDSTPRVLLRWHTAAPVPAALGRTMFCIFAAMSSVRSAVVPPAPQVMSQKVGPYEAIRSCRSNRFSTPCAGAAAMAQRSHAPTISASTSSLRSADACTLLLADWHSGAGAQGANESLLQAHIFDWKSKQAPQRPSIPVRAP